MTEGAAFPEFSRSKHVTPSFELPPNFPRIRAADYGYASPSCVLWGAIDWDNNIWVYRELYVKQLTAEQLADRILQVEQEDPTPHYTVLDSSCWNKTGFGPSIAETMMRCGVRWMPSDRNRLQGKWKYIVGLQMIQEQTNLDYEYFRIVSTLSNNFQVYLLAKQMQKMWTQRQKITHTMHCDIC